jgi:hypothetical protein
LFFDKKNLKRYNVYRKKSIFKEGFMKKTNITVFAATAVLVVSLFVFGCSHGGGNDNKDDNTEDTVKARGKILILQAYGNAGDKSPAGASHSFVELYNVTEEEIKLDGINLYYANGKNGADVTEDEAWKSIALTGTIPARGSFLVLGAKHGDLSATRYIIDNDYGDIIDDNLSLSRRSFKVALISGSAELTAQNPFASNDGKPVSGYIDMAGARNDPDTDYIFGYETSPARNSASSAIRRRDLKDSDINTNDFIPARYGPTSGDDITLSEEEFEVRKPRNSKAGTWDPFAKPADPPPPPDTTGVDYSKLKLNEVSGVGGDSEKFYELINNGDKDIPLSGCKIYYNANGATGGMLPSGKGELTWTGSTSQTIKKGELLSLIGRNTVDSFTTGLTAARTLVITLEDPAGKKLDQCVRAGDTGDYAITDKSFSRIPDGKGDFYFTTPTPNAKNGTSTAGLTKLPIDYPLIIGLGRDISSVTPGDKVTVSATVKTTASKSSIKTVVLKWTLGGAAQSDINMTKNGDVYSAEIPAQALNSVVAYKVSVTDSLGKTVFSAEENYKVNAAPIDYKKLVLNEVSGNNKFVEIYNSGTVAIPLEGVKLQRNDGPTGGSEWVGKADDSIPAGAYRLILFNSAPADLESNPAYVGWKVGSGISSGQILKVAIVDPAGIPVDVFIRGDVPLPGSWGGTSGVTQNNTDSYSRMNATTWAYADQTPGAVNGAKKSDITSPGYLTAQPK